MLSPPQAYKTYRLGGQISELLYSPATYGVDFSSKDLIKVGGASRGGSSSGAIIQWGQQQWG